MPSKTKFLNTLLGLWLDGWKKPAAIQFLQSFPKNNLKNNTKNLTINRNKMYRIWVDQSNKSLLLLSKKEVMLT